MAAAVLVVGLAVPAAITVTSTPAHASAGCSSIDDGTYNGLLKIDIPPACSNVYVSQVHSCRQVVPGSAAQAVECADVYVTNNGSSHFIEGAGKFYCQGTYGQCQGMHVSNLLAYTDESTNGIQGFTQGATYTCNPKPGPACPGNGEKGAKVLYSGAAVLATYNPNQTSGKDCMKVYSFDPADGWNGYPQVMEPKTLPGVHEYVETDSINAEICFE
jgi:hypothetical protein